MTAIVFVDGAAGTTGLEIVDRLEGRDEFELIVLDETLRKSDAARRDAFHAADFAVLCLPDDASREAVQLANGSEVRLIDASSAHRVAKDWTYGFPELVGRETVAEADRVSNPGCYPTGFLALVAPLVRAGLLAADWPYTVNAVSGYSGGGKALIERFESDRDMAFRAYGLSLGHKHLGEMRVHAGLTFAPVFSPSVVQAYRGMVVDVPLQLSAMPNAPTAEGIGDCLENAYEGSAIVTVHPNRPNVGELIVDRASEPWDGLDLFVFSDDTGQARLVAMLDNLGKGASGAAVQNLNLMAGLDETAGLRL